MVAVGLPCVPTPMASFLGFLLTTVSMLLPPVELGRLLLVCHSVVSRGARRLAASGEDSAAWRRPAFSAVFIALLRSVRKVSFHEQTVDRRAASVGGVGSGPVSASV